MNSKRIALGIGIVLLVLAVLTTHAAAHRAYFVPQHSNETIGNTTNMDLYLEIDADETLLSGQLQIQFDPTHVKVTENWLLCQYVYPSGPDEYCWGSFSTNSDYERSGYMWGGVSTPRVSKYIGSPVNGWRWVDTADGLFHGPLTVPVGTYVIEANGTPGVSPFDFGFEHMPPECAACQKCKFCNGTGIELDITWENGTFTHLAGPLETETFTKSLPLGWNQVSLPLTPTDSSTSAVLSGVSQNTVKQYNATSKLFEDAATMDPGIGYFVNVTTAGTWEYEGTAYTSMTISLSQGLNMVGWMNTSADLPGALSSISGNYTYVAHWNATSESYEVYEPNAPEVFNDFATMERGEGYFIAATSSCTLTYP